MKTNILTHKKMKNKEESIYVRQCVSLSPNNDEWQEITVTCELFNGDVINLVFTPDDWLDTFKPSTYDHVRDSYIKYLKEKK